MSVSRTEIIHAYRHLYQHCLRAVQYSKPARYVARDRLRDAFRKSHISAYDRSRIAKTIEFLDGATKTAGLEHKILKNILLVSFERAKLAGQTVVRQPEMAMRKKAFAEFDRMIEKLNETMGLCIK